MNQAHSGHLASIEDDLQSQKRRVADLSEELKAARDQYAIERAQLHAEQLLLATRASDAQRMVEFQNRQISLLNSTISRMAHSLSWRITAPFRLLSNEAACSVGPDPHPAWEPFAPSSGGSTSGSVQAPADKPLHAKDLATLLKLPDQGFIQSAYLTILGRLPDDDGLMHFGDRLRSGDSRMAILRDLYRSKEARNAEVRIPWLSRAIVRYRIAYFLLLGFVRRSGRTVIAKDILRTEPSTAPRDNRAAELARNHSVASPDLLELNQRLGKSLKEPPASPDIISGESVVVKRVLRELQETIQTGRTV